MGKIKDFFSKWFDEEVGLCILLFLVIAAVIIGVESLLFWIGGLFPSVENLGLTIDAILFMLLVLPAFIGAGLTNHRGNGNILVGLTAIMGIYISVVWYFHAGILVGCLVLLYMALWRLHKLEANLMWTCGGAYAYLLYCIGAYFAMIFNGLEPAINIYGIITLIIAAICILFMPVRESVCKTLKTTLMAKKKKKVEEVPDYIRKFRESYNRYQRNYAIIVFLCLAVVVAVWYFTNHFWGIVAFAFGYLSWIAYDEGASENCMDEYEYAYPKDGFRRMVKSWPWFFVLAILAFFFCNAYMPWLF
jgi:hypothetical protein